MSIHKPVFNTTLTDEHRAVTSDFAGAADVDKVDTPILQGVNDINSALVRRSVATLSQIIATAEKEVIRFCVLV
jgi:hypothetical protein